jgi:glycosyltransferase involved in cell wall biosynthesis
MSPVVATGAHTPRSVERQTQPICFLCSRFRPEQYGGVEERLWQVTTEMVRQGHQVEVLTENRSGAPAEEELVPGLRVRRFEPFHPGRQWRWYFLAQTLWWFRRLRAHRPTGFVWATDPTMAVAAIAAGYRRSLIYNPASCAAGVSHIGRQHPQASSLHVPRLLERLDRLACRWARAIVVSSENVKAQFDRFYGTRDNMHVIPYAIGEVPLRPPQADARRTFGVSLAGFVIGFVGRLDPCKGLEFLFAGARQCGLGPDDRIVIVGSGSDQGRLRQLVEAEGLGAHVVWAGHVADTSAVYPAFDVLVLPSFYEAFGLVMLEAMSAGVPVIGRASDGHSVFTAASEVVSHGTTGFVTRSDDPAELAVHLQWLRTHPADRAAMGERARQAATSRTWRDVVSDYRAMMRHLS